MNYTGSYNQREIRCKNVSEHGGEVIKPLLAGGGRNMRKITIATFVSLVIVVLTFPAMAGPPENFLTMAPVADPNGPYEAYVGETILFDGSGSFDPDGGLIIRYTWDFGNGDFYTEEPGDAPDGVFDGMVEYFYDSSGTFVVNLEVWDEQGEIGVGTTTAEITEPPSTDPVEIINTLTETTRDMGLNYGIENSLAKKLEKAVSRLENDDLDGAISIFEAFGHQVSALTGTQQLTDEQADTLMNAYWDGFYAMQMMNFCKLKPAKQWDLSLDIPVGPDVYDIHVEFDKSVTSATVRLWRKGWTAAFAGNTATFKTSTHPFKGGQRNVDGFRVILSSAGKPTDLYYTDVNGAKIGE